MFVREKRINGYSYPILFIALFRDRLPEGGTQSPDALVYRDFRTYLAGVGDCRDLAGSGRAPRVSRPGWLEAAGEAGEQLRLGACSGEGDAHAACRLGDARGDLEQPCP